MRDLSVLELTLRLLAAAAAGCLLGFERELRARPAGVKTHALVALGAALFTIAGGYGFAGLPRGPNVDPARIAAQVASGIGFLGAGAILRDRMGVRGLTTAATLWLCAALGVAAGAGAYLAVLIGASTVLVVLVVLRVVTPLLLRLMTHTALIEVDYERGHGTLEPVLQSVKDAHGRVHDIDLVDDEDVNGGVRHATVRVSTRDDEHLHTILDALQDRPEVKQVHVTPRSTLQT